MVYLAFPPLLSAATVTCEIPQGSILGHFSFFLFGFEIKYKLYLCALGITGGKKTLAVDMLAEAG